MKIINAIYRFLNIEGEVIYIGKAKDLQRRLKNHKHLPKECYQEKVATQFAIFKFEDEMDLAERMLISKHNPKYNTIFGDKDIEFDIDLMNKLKWYNYDQVTIESEEVVKQLTIYKCDRDIKEAMENEKDLLRKMMIIGLNRRKKAEVILGEREYLNMPEDIVALMIEYDIYSIEGLKDRISDEVVNEIVETLSDRLRNNGFFGYNIMCEEIYNKCHNKDLIRLFDKDDKFTYNMPDGIDERVDIIIEKIEEELNKRFGGITKEILYLKRNLHIYGRKSNRILEEPRIVMKIAGRR